MRLRRSLAAAALAGTALAASPAQAQDYPPYIEGPHYGHVTENGEIVYRGEWQGEWEAEDRYDGTWTGAQYGAGPRPLPPQPGMRQRGYSEEERESWLAECRRRYSSDDGVGGALIGGVIGGFAGNRIAGSGNRVVGTVAGAAVGAVAGAAIDKAEDRGRIMVVCEDYLARYEAGYGAAGYGHQSYGYGYGQHAYGPVMWVPMVVGMDCKPKKRIVIEEPIKEKPAKRVVPDKRVKTVKTVKTAPATKVQPAPARGKTTKYVK